MKGKFRSKLSHMPSPRPDSRSTPNNQESVIKAKLLMEYYKKRPTYEKVLAAARVQIEAKLIEINLKRKTWERIAILARVKEFESAFNKLKRSREGNELDSAASWKQLNDMVALKIRVFPNNYLKPVEEIIRKLYPSAKKDHEPKRIKGISDEDYYDSVERLKFFAQLNPAYKMRTTFEIQIVPFILDAFMDIEHDIVYKPDVDIPKIIPRLMHEHNKEIIGALKTWPKNFSSYMRKYAKETPS